MSSMQVGPVHYPPRPHGVPVIMRGPHGQRLAADPIKTPSGWTWWSEQMADAGLYKEPRLPVQRVVELLGLGGLGAVGAQHKVDMTKAVTSVEGMVSAFVSSGTPPANIARATISQVREELARAGRWQDSGPGYDTHSRLLRRIRTAHTRLIEKDRPGRISPDAVDSQGRMRVGDTDWVQHVPGEIKKQVDKYLRRGEQVIKEGLPWWKLGLLAAGAYVAATGVKAWVRK